MNSEETPMQAEMWLRDVKTIKVFAHALRLQIIRLMEQPTTVKNVAAELNMPASKLYYHVNMLHEHGLIRVVAHNIDGNLVEKVYQVTARQFKLVNPLLSDTMPDDSATALFSSMLQATERDFAEAYRQRDKSAGTPPRAPFMSKKAFRLTDEQLTALHAKLDALIREVTELGNNNSESEAEIYDLTVVFYKQP